MGNPMDGRFAALYPGTVAERTLEAAVAALGVPYRTNFPLYLFQGGLKSFPDFLIPSLELVIEVDGESHKGTEQADLERAADMYRVYGWRTVRIPNAIALADPFGAVTQCLLELGLARPMAPASLVLPQSCASARREKRPSRRGSSRSTRGKSASARSRKARSRAKTSPSASR